MRIRERVGERRARNRWLVPISVAAAVALVAGGVVGGLALANNDDNASVRLPVASSSATVTATTTPKPSAVPAPPGPLRGHVITVPVYYLHDTGRAIRLYREFHSVGPGGADTVQAAVHEMLAVSALDKDYTSIWPQGTDVRHATIHGQVATIDLTRQAQGQFGGGTEAGQMSIQQLVWTVTAADNSVKSVLITVEDKPVTTLFGVDVSAPQKRNLSYLVLGAVWILAPTAGASVHSPVTISGQATVFEGTVAIEIRRGSTLVKRMPAQATTGAPGRGEWKLTVALPPGSYVVRAFEASAKDGSVQNLDDKTFTVR